MKPKISILLPAYKSENLFKEVFWKGLFNCSVGVETIVYDNGGNGDLGVYRSSSITVIGDGENIGLNAALNACAKVATGDWYFLPHTDMYLLPGWDITLLDAVKNEPPNKVLLCSRSIEPTKGHTNHYFIKDFGREWSDFKKEELLEFFKDYKETRVEIGARMPFFLHKSLWKAMGGVDEKYFSYCTDDDLVQEAYHVGVRKYWMVHGSVVYHLQGASNKQQSVDRNSEAPYKYFVDKWRKKGYNDADHPGRWHPKIIPFETRIK